MEIMEIMGRGFEDRVYTGELIHSACLEDYCNLIENFNPEMDTCFSTYGSIGRGIEIIYKVEKKEGQYTDYDADAGRNYGYDEFRAIMTEEEMQTPERILVDQETYDYIWCEAISDDGDEEIQNGVYQMFEDWRLLQVLEVKQ